MRTPTPPPRRSAGFSLVELIVILAVVGVMLSLAAPSLSAFLTKHRASRTLDRLSADIAYARMHAVRSGGPTVLRTAANGRYSIATISVTGDTVVLRTVSLADDYPGVVFADPSVRLHFSSRGLVTNSSNDRPITIVTPLGRDSLVVTPAGRVFRAR
jgi:Tfp pilus assembly protein FimT